MRFFTARTGLAVLIASMFAVGTAYADSFSFTGTFTSDDQLEEIPFSVAPTEVVTIETFGYAGGINQAGDTIPEGGFDPYLAIFDSLGNLVQVNDNGMCGQVGTDSVTGSCFDSYISQSLDAGSYTLVLSESPNIPNDNLLADGYTDAGMGDFTGGYYGCADPAFCDANGDTRTGNWALDIDNVATAGSTVPEPGTVPLVGGALAAIAIWRRRRSAAQLR